MCVFAFLQSLSQVGARHNQRLIAQFLCRLRGVADRKILVGAEKRRAETRPRRPEQKQRGGHGSLLLPEEKPLLFLLYFRQGGPTALLAVR